MRNNTNGIANVAFIIDGYFGLTLYKHIKQVLGKTIDFNTIVNSTCAELERRIGKKCVVPTNLRVYYMGKNLDNLNSTCNRYEENLQLARFAAKSRPLHGGREKGIDTMLYSDVIKWAQSHTFDFLVLLAGDADHVILVQDLNDMGIPTLLLYGEIMTKGRKTTGCSSELKQACFHSINLFNLLNRAGNRPSGNATMSSKRTNHIPATGFRSPSPTHKAVFQATPRNNSNLLQKVQATVRQVIAEKEQSQGRRLAFAFQSQVGTQLQRNGINLPVSLGEYLASYPNIFLVGAHPITQAATVSIIRGRNFNSNRYY